MISAEILLQLTLRQKFRVAVQKAQKVVTTYFSSS
jgi:hypothetical protein